MIRWNLDSIDDKLNVIKIHIHLIDMKLRGLDMREHELKIEFDSIEPVRMALDFMRYRWSYLEIERTIIRIYSTLEIENHIKFGRDYRRLTNLCNEEFKSIVNINANIKILSRESEDIYMILIKHLDYVRFSYLSLKELLIKLRQYIK